MLGANAVHLARLGHRDRLQNRWHSGSEIHHTIGAGVDENDRHPDGLQVLLILEILIHRDEDVELVTRASQQLPVCEPSPACAGHGLHLMVRQLDGEIVRERLVK